MENKDDKKNKTMNNREKIMLISVIAIILIVILAVISLTLIPKKTENTRYSININYSGINNYTLIVPVIVDGDTEMDDIIERIEVINGTCNFSFIDSVYGKAMKIHGNASVLLSLNVDSSQDYWDLSLQNTNETMENESKIWLYCYCKDVSLLSLELHYVSTMIIDHGPGNVIEGYSNIKRLSTNMTIGWNEYIIESYTVGPD